MPHDVTALIAELANTLTLGGLIERVRCRFGNFRVLDHWQEGEHHHDLVLELDEYAGLPGRFLLVSTNSNGGVKEVHCLASPPDRAGLWHSRCPEQTELVGPPPQILASARTLHWFEPRELLGSAARLPPNAARGPRRPRA